MTRATLHLRNVDPSSASQGIPVSRHDLGVLTSMMKEACTPRSVGTFAFTATTRATVQPPDRTDGRAKTFFSGQSIVRGSRPTSALVAEHALPARRASGLRR